MKKSWGLIPKILTGEKTIESRWYKAKYAPWGKIQKGDTVYFKNAGEPVTAVARVQSVLQIDALTREKVIEIIRAYGQDIALSTKEYTTYYDGKKYCILIFLEQAYTVPPFTVDKTGFGTACAWMYIKTENGSIPMFGGES